MYEIVSDLINFLNNRKVPPSLAGAVEQVGTQSAVSAASQVLSALTRPSDERLAKLLVGVPHPLREAKQKIFIRLIPELAGVVFYDESGHCISSSLVDDDADKMMAFIREKYRPHLRYH